MQSRLDRLHRGGKKGRAKFSTRYWRLRSCILLTAKAVLQYRSLGMPCHVAPQTHIRMMRLYFRYDSKLILMALLAQ